MSQPPLFEQIEQLKAADARDEFFGEAVRIVQEHGRVSISLLQRKLRIGYGRAARLVDQLEEAGIVGPDLGAGQAREVRNEPPGDNRRRDEAAPTNPPQQAPSAPSAPAPRPRIIGGDDDSDDAGAAPASRSQFWW